MISSDVRSNAYLRNDEKENAHQRHVFSTQKFKDITCVLSYKMRLHQGKVRLMTIHKDVASCFREVSPSSVKKESYKTYERESNKSRERFPLYSSTFYSYKHVSLPCWGSFPRSSNLSLYKERHLEGQDTGQSSYTSMLSLNRFRLSTFSQVLFYNHCREKVRERKLFLLKRCRTPILGKPRPSCAGLPAFRKGGDVKRYNPSIPKRRHRQEGGGVWKEFTSTLMRHGDKLRYQTVLRKALLAG